MPVSNFNLSFDIQRKKKFLHLGFQFQLLATSIDNNNSPLLSFLKITAAGGDEEGDSDDGDDLPDLDGPVGGEEGEGEEAAKGSEAVETPAEEVTAA